MSDTINVLMLGDVIGTPGMEQLMMKLGDLKKKEKIDFTIANGENSDNGFGITEQLIRAFMTYGVDVITSGNHIWANKEAPDLLNDYDILLRPANYPDVPGKGWCIKEVKGINIGVVNLIGRFSMTPVDCPFQTLNKLLKNELKNCRIVIVDFHAESNAEKQALGFDFDGKVSLVVGTHTHVQTADEQILPKGTGFITDLGMCGGFDSVIGMKKEIIIQKSTTQMSIPFEPSAENCHIQGIIAEIDTETKICKAIKRFYL